MKLSRSTLGAILTIKKTGRGKTAMYSMTIPKDLGDTTIRYNTYKAIQASRMGFLNKYTPVGK
jgi:hypothetical protein